MFVLGRETYDWYPDIIEMARWGGVPHYFYMSIFALLFRLARQGLFILFLLTSFLLISFLLLYYSSPVHKYLSIKLSRIR